MRCAEKLIYTNENGESVEFSFDSEYIPISFTDSLDNNIHTTKSAGQDGETVQNIDLEPRELAIKAVFQVRPDTAKAMVRRIIKVFNPKLCGTLAKLDGNEYKDIEVQVDGRPKITYKGAVGQVIIDLIAFGSYWRSNAVAEALATLTKCFYFPQPFAPNPVPFALKRAQLISSIINKGDADAGVVITLTAAGGTVTAPFIKNRKTGQQVAFNCTMEKGDVIKIDASSDEVIVYLNGTKDFTILDAVATEFFKILVGENEIEYGAGDNVSNLEVTMQYRPLLL